MRRKTIYTLLALPFVVLVIYMLALPGPRRATFISEFKHRTALLFGFEPKPLEGPRGLRSERPEEYGLGSSVEEVAESSRDAKLSEAPLAAESDVPAE